MRDIKIIPYSSEYRQAVRDCVYETGYGGDSAEIYFEDRELFADLITLYYTDYEPESAFIPLVDGEPAGYLLGCLDTAACDRFTEKEMYPNILKNLLLGKYKNVGPGARRNMFRGLLCHLRGERIHVPLDEFPAHLHIDLFEPYRRFGLGGMLIKTYLEYLREKNIRGVHLGTSSAHTLSHGFYEKQGFQRYSAVRIKTPFFKEIIDNDFYNVVYVKKIL